MKKGFTLIEVLVASMLMGMLVAVLTVAFNQSAVAWRTGKAGVSQLTEARQKMIWYHATATRALPHLEKIKFNENIGRWECDSPGSYEKYVIQNAWDDEKGGLNTRGLVAPRTIRGVGLFEFEYPASSWRQTAKGDGADSVDAITVGVMSAGPNRKWGDDDDISSWPEKK